LAKQLDLQFYNAENKTVTISLDDPVEPVDAAAVSAAMDTVLAENAFTSSGGDYVSKKGARIVERNVTDIDIGL
jgi:hypothetical protein